MFGASQDLRGAKRFKRSQEDCKEPQERYKGSHGVSGGFREVSSYLRGDSGCLRNFSGSIRFTKRFQECFKGDTSGFRRLPGDVSRRFPGVQGRSSECSPDIL